MAYNERGKLLTSGEYDKGYEKGLWKYYSLKGVLEKEVNFKEGRKEGAYKEYYPSGEVSVAGQYANNQKEGVWKYYTEAGQLSKEVEYKAGNQQSVTKYELKEN